jgi:hypothetical protein
MMVESIELDKIKRYGRTLRQFTLALMLLTPVAAVTAVLLRGPLALVTIPPNIDVNLTALNFPAALAIIGVGLLTPATFLAGFLFLYRLFDLYAQGIVFSERNVAAIRRCGYVLMAVDLVRMIQSALTGPVLTALGAVKGYITVQLGISVLIIGLAIVLISHVMSLGCKIYESDRLTI